MSAPEPSARRETAVNRAVSLTLRAGILVSGGLILVGVVLAFIGGGVPAKTMAGDNGFLTLMHEPWTAALLTNPTTWYYAGMLVLMLTPILRVMVAIVSFVVERDRAYVFISLTVLVILCISVVVAFLQ